MPKFSDRRIVFLAGQSYETAHLLKNSLLGRDYQLDVINNLNETTLSCMLSQELKSYRFAIIYFSDIREKLFVETMNEELKKNYGKIKVFGVTCGRSASLIRNCNGVFIH